MQLVGGLVELAPTSSHRMMASSHSHVILHSGGSRFSLTGTSLRSVKPHAPGETGSVYTSQASMGCSISLSLPIGGPESWKRERVPSTRCILGSFPMLHGSCPSLPVWRMRVSKTLLDLDSCPTLSTARSTLVVSPKYYSILSPSGFRACHL